MRTIYVSQLPQAVQKKIENHAIKNTMAWYGIKSRNEKTEMLDNMSVKEFVRTTTMSEKISNIIGYEMLRIETLNKWLEPYGIEV